MDYGKLESESNQLQQNRDRSRRCHSRLSDALAYAKSETELPESVNGLPDQETSDMLLTELVASVRGSPGLATSDNESPGQVASVRESPGQVAFVRESPGQVASVQLPSSEHVTKRAVSDITVLVDKTDYKRNLSRTSSETAKIHLPTHYRFDIPEFNSALCSPEPSLFTMAYRIQASPPPFTARPLPPIKRSQQEKESELKKQKLDAEQFERKTEAKDAESESWDKIKKLEDCMKTQEEGRQGAVMEEGERQMEVKHSKLNGPRGGTVVGADNFSFVKPDQEITDGISDINVTETPTIVRERLMDLQRKGKLPQSATIVPKPPIRPKGSIVVRETKASRLRKVKLQMQNEQQDETLEILPPLKTPVKPTEQSTIAQTPTRSSQFAPTPRLQISRRPDCVSKLSRNDSPSRNSTLPPELVVRETKASKLRRLKKVEDEEKAQRLKMQEEKTNFAFGQRVEESIMRKRSPTPTFKPAPPKPYKKPGPVVIKETRASKMRKAQEVEDGKIAHSQKKEEKRKKDAYGQRVKQPIQKKQSPTPTFKLAPPKPYIKPGPVVIRETRASKLRKANDIKKTGNEETPDGPQQPLQQPVNVKRSGEFPATETRSSRSRQQVPSKKLIAMKRSDKSIAPRPLPPITKTVTEYTVEKETETTPAILRELRESRKLHQQYIEDEDLVATPRVKWSGSRTLHWLVDNPSEQISSDCSNTLQTNDPSYPQTEEENDESDSESLKFLRSLTPVEIEWKPPTKKRILSAIPRKGTGFISNLVSPSWRVESPVMTSTPIPRKGAEKEASVDETMSKDSEMKVQKTKQEQEALDRSARDRFCRKEVVRGYKVRKQIRLAMDNKGDKWQSELESEIKIIDEAPRVQRPIATNRNMVQQELDALRERLEEVEAAEINEQKLKDKSSFSSKFKTYFKGKKTVKDEDKIKKERKEKIDECFRKTEEKFSRQLGYDWWTFLLQQNCHHEMLKKSRLQEELIYLWKSQAIHYNVHHTMLGKDMKEGRKESWYL